jgi:hypothetical protein
VEFGFELRTIFDHPTVDGGMIDVDATLLHEFFDMTSAQRVREISARSEAHIRFP